MSDTSSVAAGGGGGKLRFLTFHSGGKLYALPADEVTEVMRVPAVARLPQSPKSLLGLANLRGTVLPVASLRALLGADVGAAIGRAIVLDGDAPVALTVDDVADLVAIDASKFQHDEGELSASAGERLRGAFKSEESDAVAKVLDIRAMLAAALIQPAQTRQRANVRGVQIAAVINEERTTRKLVTFDVAGQEFALGLDDVREIIRAPEGIAAVPHSEALVIGVSAYRDRLLPLLSLRVLLGMADSARSSNDAVIVAVVNGALVGLVADRMRAIISADLTLVEPPPTVLAARVGGEAQIKAIYRGEGGRRLVSILAPDSLFREDVMQRLGAGAQGAAAAESTSANRADELKYLVFHLGADEFALPIDAVVEVARVPEQITRLPKTPDFLEGVINLRGEVLPVIDQRRRFEMPAASDTSGRRLIVVRSERHRAGLIVDSVSEVLRSTTDAIGPAPSMAGDATRLIAGVINLEASGRLVMIFDPDELLSRTERNILDAFVAEPNSATP